MVYNDRKMQELLKQKEYIDKLLEDSIKENFVSIFLESTIKEIRKVTNDLSVVAINRNKEMVGDIIPETLMFNNHSQQVLVVDGKENIFGKEIDKFYIHEQMQILDMLKKELKKC